MHGVLIVLFHSHTALFGVYGMLAISLLLFSVRHIVSRTFMVEQNAEMEFWGPKWRPGVYGCFQSDTVRVLSVVFCRKTWLVVCTQP